MSQTEAIEATSAKPFLGWRMLTLGFLAQNFAIGINYGTYGTLVTTIEAHFSSSRTFAAAGLSMMVLTMGLMSPIVGSLAQKISLRVLMITGALACALGYFLLANTQNIYALFAIYALIIGPGVCCLGNIPSATLVSNWFVKNRGKSLGILNMPLFILIFPYMAVFILAHYHIEAVFLTLAICFLALVPFLLFVVSTPQQVGQHAFGVNNDSNYTKTPPQGLTTKAILRSRNFQVITLGFSLCTAGSIMIITHMVSIALDKGLSLSSASLILSIQGGSAALGSLFFGWLNDRIGPRLAFIILAFTSIPAWALLLINGGQFATLALTAFLIGALSGGVLALFSSSMAAWLGQENMSRGMGLCYMLQMPLMFCAAPFAGYLFDNNGSYDTAIVLHIAAYAIVGLVFLRYKPVGSNSPHEHYLLQTPTTD